MRFCPKCNQELDNEALFCTKCGAKQEYKCAACGAELTEDSKFCIKCGKSVINEENLQKQNMPGFCDNTSSISKNKINIGFNNPKIAIIIILAVIFLIGYFTIYGSNRDFVKLKLDRGVSLTIPKDWNIVEINKINTDMPQVEVLLQIKNINNNNSFFVAIGSNNSNIFTPEQVINISQKELNEMSKKIKDSNVIFKEQTLKYHSDWDKTPKGIFKYPSLYYYKTYSTSEKKNIVNYQWLVVTERQELYINFTYDMDIHSDNKLYDTITKIVLPSIIVE